MPRFGYVLLALSVLSGCAVLNKNSSGGTSDSGERFYDSAMNDRNRPGAPIQIPADTPSLTPEKMNPMQLQTKADYYFSVGESNSLDGNHQAALEAFKQALVYDGGSEAVHLRLASEYAKLGVLSKGLEHAQRAATINPKSIESQMLLGGLYSSLREYNKSVESYQMVLVLDPKNAEAPLYLGAVSAEQKDFDKSIKYFELLTKSEDSRTAYLAYYYIGRVHLEQNIKNSYHDAEIAFRKALQLRPNYPDAALALAGIYQHQDNETKARELLRQFQHEHGPNSRVAEALSQIYLENNEYELAYDQLVVLENSTEDNLNIKVRLALILMELKRYEKAIVKLREILRIVPDSDKILFYLAAVYEEIGEKENAVAHYKRVPPSSSFFSESAIHACYLLKTMNKLDAALELAAENYKIKADQPQIVAIYANLLDESKNYKAAEKILAAGIEKFPDQAQLHFFMGAVQDHLGQTQAVIESMRQVLRIEPNHVQGLNYLAFTFADTGENLEEAERLARKALELDPHDGYILDTLGWVLFKRGDFVKCVPVLESAIKVQPNESIIAEHLGDAYVKVDLPDKARQMYEKAATLENEGKKLQGLKAKISGVSSPAYRTPPVTTDPARSPASENP